METITTKHFGDCKLIQFFFFWNEICKEISWNISKENMKNWLDSCVTYYDHSKWTKTSQFVKENKREEYINHAMLMRYEKFIERLMHILKLQSEMKFKVFFRNHYLWFMCLAWKCSELKNDLVQQVQSVNIVWLVLQLFIRNEI